MPPADVRTTRRCLNSCSKYNKAWGVASGPLHHKINARVPAAPFEPRLDRSRAPVASGLEPAEPRQQLGLGNGQASALYVVNASGPTHRLRHTHALCQALETPTSRAGRGFCSLVISMSAPSPSTQPRHPSPVKPTGTGTPRESAPAITGAPRCIGLEQDRSTDHLATVTSYRARTRQLHRPYRHSVRTPSSTPPLLLPEHYVARYMYPCASLRL